MKVPETYYDEIYNFKGQWEIPSKCGLKIIDRDGKYYVIVTELYQNNPGTSVTYAGKSLAMQICEEKGLSISEIVYLECTPDTNSVLSFYDEQYFEVIFNETPRANYRKLSKEEINHLFDREENKYKMPHIFDDIRPYVDTEIPAAMERITENEYFPELCKFVFPEKKVSDVKELLHRCRSIYDFQMDVMHLFNKQVIAQTINNFTFNGFHKLDPHKNYLFVSNHRDIVLDASLLQSALVNEGFRTTEITFGSNLMNNQLVVDIGKSNKMFKVMRGGNAREFYRNSISLSEYIRYTLTQKGESIWIAQRNGRTKDGNDATEHGIIRMFCMSDKEDLVKSISALNIVPVAVSYQWEPCDKFKTKELLLSKGGKKHIKQKDEDLSSILTGITQQKGNVNFSICKPLEKEEYSAFTLEPSNKFYSNLANLIDERIYDNYKLWNNNYIAHDLRSGTNKYEIHYTQEEKNQFIQRYHNILNQIDGEKDLITSIFLGIYANPIDNSSGRRDC